MSLFHKQSKSANNEPLMAEIKLVAEECGLLMGCLSWVNGELTLMKKTVLRTDEKKMETKALIGGERHVEDMKRNVIAMVESFTPLVKYQQECFITEIRDFLDNNAKVNVQDRNKFFDIIQKRIEMIQRVQDIKMKVDAMSRVLAAMQSNT